MRKVYLRLYVDAIVTMDDGVELSDALDLAEPSLHIRDDRVTEIDVQIMHHEVTDSK